MMIPVVNDNIHEPLESFSVALSLSCNQSGVLLGQRLATVVINDDDSKYYTDHSLFVLYHSIMESLAVSQ